MRGKLLLIVVIILAVFTLLPNLPFYYLEESRHSKYDDTEENLIPVGIDSDGDSLYDFLEDEDGNGVLTGEEISPTDPYIFDTDADSFGDGEEFNYWIYRAENQNHVPAWLRAVHPNATYDQEFFDLYLPYGDLDGDGLVNILDQDSDGDWVADGIEIERGTDPANPWTDEGVPDANNPGGSGSDADGDGMDDRWEDAHDVDDPFADPDNDGKSNLQEYLDGTNPTHPGDTHSSLGHKDSSIDGFYNNDMNAPVFFVDPADSPRYWRLTAYDEYTGYGWTQKYITNATYPADIDLPDIERSYETNMTTYKVTFWGAVKGYIPTALYTVNVPLDPGNYTLDKDLYPPSFSPHVYLDTANGFSTSDYTYDYNFTSLTYEFDQQAFKYANSTEARSVDSEYYFYAKTPTRTSTRIAELAASIITNTELGASDYEKAQAIQTYLKTKYTYDINATEQTVPQYSDVIEYFLFESQKGVCTHFASSFVLMCKYQHIPARYVTGYALGDLEDGKRIVKEGHKHAWAEVYFDGFGWIPFEATPPNVGTTGGTGVDSAGQDDNVHNDMGGGDGGGTLQGKNETDLLDTDGDGIPNEIDDDDDNDGLTDEQEEQLGTDPLKKDTDNDGILDFTEVSVYGTNPLAWDTDGDMLSDGQEINDYFTNPNNADTDGGGASDGSEVMNGKDPLDPSDDEEISDMDGDGLDDVLEDFYGTNKTNPDTDGDGLNDGQEIIRYFTDPLDPDSDQDNITDYEEVRPGDDNYITNPNQKDTDMDTLSDWMEIHVHDTDPTERDTDSDGLWDNAELDDADGFTTNPLDPDTDGDGLLDGAEDKNGNSRVDSTDPDDWQDGAGLGETDPNVKDTDGGGVWDSSEVWNGLNPLDPSDDVHITDTDYDGLTDVLEQSIGTDPNDPDTDDDGLSDGEEFNTYHTNATNPDTDFDSIKDSEEVHKGIDGYQTNPKKNDTDNDGLNDAEEINKYQTDPTKPDTDGDDLSDGLEVNTDFNKTKPGVQGSDPLVKDTDGGGMEDGEEYFAGKNPLDPSDDQPPKDTDSDGLPDELEDLYGTNRTNPDTDGDGLTDGQEVNTYGTNPLSRDTDQDALSDREEVLKGNDGYVTNASNPDTDNDGLNDTQEFNYGTNPNSMDTDNDGLSDYYELFTDLDPNPGQQTTDPLKPDTDNDGLKDGAELNTDWNTSQPGNQKLNPLDPDTDKGGAPDGWEVFKKTDPLFKDDDISVLDTDGDKLTDLEEINIYHTNHTNPDTDNDGLNDGEEINTHLTNATNFDTDGDNITDGSEVKGKFGYKTNPLLNDTDGDTLTDWMEIFQHGTNPTLKDTDGDGLTDDIEVGMGGGGRRGPGPTRSDPTNPDTDGDGLPDGWMDGWDYEQQKVVDSKKNGLIDVGEFEDRNLNGKVDNGTWTGSAGTGETDPLNADTDGGGAPDGWEEFNDNDPLNGSDDQFVKDLDGDGLSDQYENATMTDWDDPDTDGDGLWDGYDVYYNGNKKKGELTPHNYFQPTNNTDWDSDNDGLSDGEEVEGSKFGKKTDPNDEDTDGDGLLDGYNIGPFLGELTYHHPGQDGPTNPLKVDTDGDNLWDGQNITINGSSKIGEYSIHTNPIKKDTDGDELWDDVEHTTDRWENVSGIQATDPNNPDTDGGGMRDGLEVIRGLDPLNPLDDTEWGDTDGDGLPNFYENHTNYKESEVDWDNNGDTDFITAWNLSDTDGDGLTDSQEVKFYNTNPLIVDTDHDGLSDFDEIMVYKTNASNPDTDGDQLTDGYEISSNYDYSNVDWNKDGTVDRNTDPNDPDTDNGGSEDGWEVDHGKNPLDKTDDVDKLKFDTLSVTLSALPLDLDKRKIPGETNFTVSGIVEDSQGDPLDQVLVTVYIMPESLYNDKAGELFKYDTETALFSDFDNYAAVTVQASLGKYSANTFVPALTPTGTRNIAVAKVSSFTKGSYNYNTTFSSTVQGFSVSSPSVITSVSVYDNQTYSKGERIDFICYLKDVGGLGLDNRYVDIYYDGMHRNLSRTDHTGRFFAMIDVGSEIGSHVIRAEFDASGEAYVGSSSIELTILLNATIVDITAEINQDEFVVGSTLWVNGTVIAEGLVNVPSGTVDVSVKKAGGPIVETLSATITDGVYHQSVYLDETDYGGGEYSIIVIKEQGEYGSAVNNSNSISIIGKTYLNRGGMFANSDNWVESSQEGRWFTGYLEENRGFGLAGRKVTISYQTTPGGDNWDSEQKTTTTNGAFDLYFEVPGHRRLGAYRVKVEYTYDPDDEGLPKYVGSSAEIIIRVQAESEVLVTSSPDTVTHSEDFNVEGTLHDLSGNPISVNGSVLVLMNGKELGSASTNSNGKFSFTHILSKFNPRGNQIIVVQFAGDDRYRPDQASFNVDVFAKTSFQIKPDPKVYTGQPFNLTILLKVDGGGSVGGAPVRIYVDDELYGVHTTDSQGQILLRMKFPSNRLNVDVRAAYEGEEDNYLEGTNGERTIKAEIAPVNQDYGPIGYIFLIGAIVLVVGAVGGFLYYFFIWRRAHIEPLEDIISETLYNLETRDKYRKAIFECYKKMCATLTAYQFMRRDSQTPYEFEKAIYNAMPDLPKGAVKSLTELFVEARYSDHKLNPTSRRRAIKSLRKIKGSLEAAAGQA